MFNFNSCIKISKNTPVFAFWAASWVETANITQLSINSLVVTLWRVRGNTPFPCWENGWNSGESIASLKKIWLFHQNQWHLWHLTASLLPPGEYLSVLFLWNVHQRSPFHTVHLDTDLPASTLPLRSVSWKLMSSKWSSSEPLARNNSSCGDKVLSRSCINSPPWLIPKLNINLLPIGNGNETLEVQSIRDVGCCFCWWNYVYVSWERSSHITCQSNHTCFVHSVVRFEHAIWEA